MNGSDRVRALRRQHPNWSTGQLAAAAGVSTGLVWCALRTVRQPKRPTGAQMNARKLRTMHPDMSVEEIARRVRLPLRQVRELLDGYAPQYSRKAKGTPYSRACCLDCGQSAKAGSARCFTCGPAHERRERARRFAEVAAQP
jgi:hypothetical protein